MNTRDFEAIAALDLEPVKVKLMHQESGEGWSLDQVNAVEFEYRRFLHLMKRFPNEAAAPLQDVDTFWHYHILDTMKYAADCEAVFGYFLHHFPYIGLRGEDDLAAHARVGERMKELYEDTFGEAYAQGLSAYSARVAGSAFFGTHYRCHLQPCAADTRALVAHLPQSASVREGEIVPLAVRAADVVALPATGGHA